MDIKDWYVRHQEPIDIENAESVEIVIRNDGTTFWINAPACVVRFCRVKEIKIIDNRKKKRDNKKERSGNRKRT